jgi:protease-4
MQKFILEIFREKWAIDPKIAKRFRGNILNLLAGKPFLEDFTPRKELLSEFKLPYEFPGNQGEGPKKEQKIAIIDLSGPMTKSGGLSSYGTGEIAEKLAEIDSSEEFISSILLVNSPGGSISSVIPMENFMQRKKKPCYALVDDSASSAAYWVASYCDQIWATSDKAEVGSIGVMARLINDKKANEIEGIDIEEFYPEESNFKNKAVNEALAGNPDMLINEHLKPLAIKFQNVVTANRPKLNLQVEGIISGKTFYGDDALRYGMIDKIGTMEELIQHIIDQQAIKDLKNSINK